MTGQNELIGPTAKRGLGPVIRGGRSMPWGKGVVAGPFVFLSGLEGSVDEDGAQVQGIEAQTVLALERGEAFLREAGSTMEHVVRLIQYLADPADRDGFHAARTRWLEAHAPVLQAEQSYAGVLLIQQLSLTGCLVELELTAVLPEPVPTARPDRS